MAAGVVSATSTDAVNGSQLYSVARNANTIGSSTAAAFGAGASYDPATGTFTAPTYVVNGNSYNNVGGAVTALDQRTTANSQTIAALQNGAAGPVRENNSSGGAAPQASGANSIAGGPGSIASGTSSTAYGQNSQATQSGAVAIGAFAMATGDPTTAVGTSAAATGNEASAFGAFAAASGDNSTALGRSATASAQNSTAVGFGASAAGQTSIAIGTNASAAQANSVAIGSGVSTTRANQVAIGTASQTYTLAGIASAGSLAAQSGPTSFVTSDAKGNLAVSSYGPAQIAALDGRVGSLEASVGALSRFAIQARNEARRGAAATAATAPVLMPSAPGKTTLSFKASTFRGEYGTGFTIAHRLDTSIPAVIFGSYSNGSARDHIISGGFGLEF